MKISNKMVSLAIVLTVVASVARAGEARRWRTRRSFRTARLSISRMIMQSIFSVAPRGADDVISSGTLGAALPAMQEAGIERAAGLKGGDAGPGCCQVKCRYR